MSPKAGRSTTAVADVDAARSRSVGYGLDSAVAEVPHVGAPGPAASAFNRLSAPVLDELVGQISDTSLAVVVADRDGRLTRCDALSPETRRAMEDRSLDIGYSLAERDVGTNGVGTSLETKRPTFIVGEEHFFHSFHGFTCANAPVINPITGRVEATVGVMCPVEDTSALLLPTAMRLSAQISDLLVEQSTPEERFLLEQFLRSRRSPRNAVAAIGQGVVIATPSAQRHLIGVDPEELWNRLQGELSEGAEIETALDGLSATPLRLHCRPLFRGGELEGAAVEFVAGPKRRRRRGRIRATQTLGSLVGQSAAWRHVVDESIRAGQVDEPVLVIGERGTGRFSVADAIARRRGGGSPHVLSSAEVVIDGDREWLRRFEHARASGSTVVLRRVDELPDHVASAVALLVDRSPEASIIATTETSVGGGPGSSALLDKLSVLQIRVQPLRERADDIAPLAHHLAAVHGQATLDAAVVHALARHSWPGNVTELDAALRSASVRARAQPMSVEHLPRHVRNAPSRMPLRGLRKQEAEAILTAIDESATRTEAAERLGISRATLFRRIKTYGLDVPR